MKAALIIIISFSIIAAMIRETGALNFVENCTISHNDHLALGDYSRDAKFQNCWLALCQCYTGSDKCDYRKKFNTKKHKRCSYIWGTTF